MLKVLLFYRNCISIYYSHKTILLSFLLVLYFLISLILYVFHHTEYIYVVRYTLYYAVVNVQKILIHTPKIEER